MQLLLTVKEQGLVRGSIGAVLGDELDGVLGEGEAVVGAVKPPGRLGRAKEVDHLAESGRQNGMSARVNEARARRIALQQTHARRNTLQSTQNGANVDPPLGPVPTLYHGHPCPSFWLGPEFPLGMTARLSLRQEGRTRVEA